MPARAADYVKRKRAEQGSGDGLRPSRLSRRGSARAAHARRRRAAVDARWAQPHWYQILEALVEAMKPYARLGVNVNVDFYAGVVYFLNGIAEDLFVPIFAVGRVPGWTVQVLEQIENNILIRPLTLYNGPAPRDYRAARVALTSSGPLRAGVDLPAGRLPAQRSYPGHERPDTHESAIPRPARLPAAAVRSPRCARAPPVRSAASSPWSPAAWCWWPRCSFRPSCSPSCWWSAPLPAAGSGGRRAACAARLRERLAQMQQMQAGRPGDGGREPARTAGATGASGRRHRRRLHSRTGPHPE